MLVVQLLPAVPVYRSVSASVSATDTQFVARLPVDVKQLVLKLATANLVEYDAGTTPIIWFVVSTSVLSPPNNHNTHNHKHQHWRTTSSYPQQASLSPINHSHTNHPRLHMETQPAHKQGTYVRPAGKLDGIGPVSEFDETYSCLTIPAQPHAVTSPRHTTRRTVTPHNANKQQWRAAHNNVRQRGPCTVSGRHRASQLVGRHVEAPAHIHTPTQVTYTPHPAQNIG